MNFEIAGVKILKSPLEMGITFNFSRKFLELLGKVFHNLMAVLHVFGMDILIAQFKVFGSFICWNLHTETVKYSQILFQLPWFVFQFAERTFEPLISRLVKPVKVTSGALITSNKIFNCSNPNQANLMPGPKITQLPKNNISDYLRSLPAL
ncbi:MAG: hypothetical protein IID16_03485 [Candidatus Marinimicrobia bacterium]|nr:hypothetical protein [Candidatus Neomarinimicrobiota bacterium]